MGSSPCTQLALPVFTHFRPEPENQVSFLHKIHKFCIIIKRVVRVKTTQKTDTHIHTHTRTHTHVHSHTHMAGLVVLLAVGAGGNCVWQMKRDGYINECAMYAVCVLVWPI